MSSKCCRWCGAEKPLTSFYKKVGMADGHLNKCIECVKAYEKSRRQDPKFRPAIVEYDRQRGAHAREGYVKEWRRQNKRKAAAHNAVAKALAAGKLERKTECEACGSPDNLHGHHDDYSKPLDVRWLCALCHRQWHLKNGEAA